MNRAYVIPRETTLANYKWTVNSFRFNLCNTGSFETITKLKIRLHLHKLNI